MFCMYINNDLLHCGIQNQLSPVFSPLNLSIFLSLFIFVKDISTTVYDRKFIFGIQNNNHKLYREIEDQVCPICSFLYLFTFLSLHAINTVIFRNRFLSNYLR